MKMTKDTVYKFFSDPSHGWLRVPMAHINELNLTDRISAYSYKNGKWAYLEEDCDYRVFEEAFKERFDIYPQLHWSVKPAKNWSVIRTYDFFRTNILIDTKPNKTEMANKINLYLKGSFQTFNNLMDQTFDAIENMYSELDEEHK
jgi:hypothetical protein